MDGNAQAPAPVAPPVATIDEPDRAPAPVRNQADAPVGNGEDTSGGDGSALALDALTADDIREARLDGELACALQSGGRTLLYATGDVASTDPAFGVIKIAGYVERVSAPGGFNGMGRDPVFSGKGMTLRFRTTAAASSKAQESPPRDAVVTAQRADGASRVLRGRWRCGP